MRIAITALALLLLVPELSLAQAKSPLHGVWRVQEVVVTGDRASTATKAQPGLWIFTAGHYSALFIAGPDRRPQFEGSGEPVKPTQAEKAARYDQWQLLTAQSGTYQVQGSTITTRPIVAKNESVMSGPLRTADFKIDGTTLT